MSIDALSGVSSTATPSSVLGSSSTATSELGKDAFLTLLVTQLKNQDPTKPMDNSAFITQLAQFSSLEKLSTIADSTTALLDVFKALGNSTITPTT